MGPDERRGDGQTSTRTGIAATTRSHAKACDVLLHCVLARGEGGIGMLAHLTCLDRHRRALPPLPLPLPHVYMRGAFALYLSGVYRLRVFPSCAALCVSNGPQTTTTTGGGDARTRAHLRYTRFLVIVRVKRSTIMHIYIYTRVCVCALGTLHLICATLPTTHRQMPYRGVHPQRSRRRQKGQAWGTEEWNR